MTPINPGSTEVNHRARAQALFDAVMRTRADIPTDARIQCAIAVGVLGEPFPDVAAARDATSDTVFDFDPAGERIAEALRTGLRELGKLPPEQFRLLFRAAEAGHDALAALR